MLKADKKKVPNRRRNMVILIKPTYFVTSAVRRRLAYAFEQSIFSSSLFRLAVPLFLYNESFSNALTQSNDHWIEQ